MNKIHIQNISDTGTEDSGLLESYPDIDYEMIPIAATPKNYVFPKHDQIFLKDLAQHNMKDLLKYASRFKVISELSSNPMLHITYNNEDGDQHENEATDLTVLLPINQISACKQAKKYTKIYLEDDQVLNTSIDFKTLKKVLVNQGFKKINKTHLISKY